MWLYLSNTLIMSCESSCNLPCIFLYYDTKLHQLVNISYIRHVCVEGTWRWVTCQRMEINLAQKLTIIIAEYSVCNGCQKLKKRYCSWDSFPRITWTENPSTRFSLYLYFATIKPFQNCASANMDEGNSILLDR